MSGVGFELKSLIAPAAIYKPERLLLANSTSGISRMSRACWQCMYSDACLHGMSAITNTGLVAAL